MLQTISTLSIPLPALSIKQIDGVDAWLRAVLWENELPGEKMTDQQKPHFEIHRLKGRLVLKDGGEKMIQGVRELFEIMDNPTSASPENDVHSSGKLVLIGRHLEEYDFPKSLKGVTEVRA